MPTPDFGPIPISQLKAQRRQIYAALSEGRRVLLSRHGRVVTVIEPMSAQHHAAILAKFAMDTPDALPQITASSFSEGSISDRIRQAEAGQPTLVTQAGKALGLLTSVTTRAEPPSDVERERAVAAFEREHPDATTAMLADVASGHEGSDRPAGVVGGLTPEHLGPADKEVWLARQDVLGARRNGGDSLGEGLEAEVLRTLGVALIQDGDVDGASEALRGAIERFEAGSGPLARRRAVWTSLELARLWLAHGRTDDALVLTRDLVDDLGLSNSLHAGSGNR